MATNDASSRLSSLASRYQTPVQPMNLNAQQYGAPVMGPVVGEGATGAVDVSRLRAEARSRGYVTGYIVANAPAITMAVNRKKDKEGKQTCDIYAKQSKPSRILSVLVALPKCCIQRQGVLAQPDEISAGNVDFDTAGKELEYYSLTLNQMKAYLNALGGRLPEYAPNVLDSAKQQWSQADILNGRPEVTYVYLKPQQSRSTKNNTAGQYSFQLKTTSPRRILFTQKNHVCLKGVKHVSTQCDTDAEAYELNRIAFGAWEYRRRKDDTENALQKAIHDCPTQIWRHKYTINEEVVDGIASVFFMSGTKMTNEAGETITQHRLKYRPWYAVGTSTEESRPLVSTITYRKFRPADGSRGAGMVTEPITFQKDGNDPIMKGYARFVDEIVRAGYITREAMFGLLKHSSTKAKGGIKPFTPEQDEAFSAWLNLDTTQAEITSIRNESANRAVLGR